MRLVGGGEVGDQQFQGDGGFEAALLDGKVAFENAAVLAGYFGEGEAAGLAEGFADYEVGVGSHPTAEFGLGDAAVGEVAGEGQQAELAFDHSDDVEGFAAVLH